MLRDFEASSQAMRRTAKPAMKEGPLLVPKSARVVSGRRPPPAHAGRSFDVSSWKVGRKSPEAKSCEGTRSASGTIKPLLGRSSSLHRTLTLHGDEMTHGCHFSVSGR